MFSFTSLRLDNVCSLKSKRSATISFRAPSLLVRVFKSPELPEVTPLLLCSFNWASAPVPNAVETVNVCGSTASKFVLIAQVHAKTEVRCNRIMAKWRLSRNWLMSDTTNPPREIQSWLFTLLRRQGSPGNFAQDTVITEGAERRVPAGMRIEEQTNIPGAQFRENSGIDPLLQLRFENKPFSCSPMHALKCLGIKTAKADGLGGQSSNFRFQCAHYIGIADVNVGSIHRVIHGHGNRLSGVGYL